MNFRRPIAALLCAFLAVPVHADFSVDTWGARSAALGGAGTGLGGEPETLSQNPASLLSLSGTSLTGSYGKPTVRSGAPARSLSSAYFVQSDTTTARALGLWGTREVSQANFQKSAIALSLAHPLAESLWGGVNVKYLQQTSTLLRDDRSSVGVDVGLFHVANERLSLGFALRDANRPRLAPGGGDARTPEKASMGASLRLAEGTSAVLDVGKTASDNTVGARGGVEQWLFDGRLALRAGASANAVTCGAGLRASFQGGSGARLDYAFVNPRHRHTADPLHTVTLSVTFGSGPRRAKARPAFTAQTPALASASTPTALREQQRTAALRLGPDDTLQISVKNHPELEAAVTVDSWSSIKMPFIGDVDVRGLDKLALEEKLRSIYASFIENPMVEVTVTQHNSRLIYVLGAVETPGRYSMQGRMMTLRDAIVMAGLPTNRAALWRVFVVRPGSPRTVFRHINLYKILYRGELAGDILLEPGDTVMVPMTILDGIAVFIGRIIGPIVGVTASIAAQATTNTTTNID